MIDVHAHMGEMLNTYLKGTLNSWVRQRQGVLENSRIPLPRPFIPVPKRVHPEPLFLSFVPRALVAVPIGEAVHTEAVDLVCKVLPCIPIAVPAEDFVDRTRISDGTVRNNANMQWYRFDWAPKDGNVISASNVTVFT